MQKQLPDLILSFFYCLEDTLEDAAAVGVDVETYPVFDSHADLRAIVRKSGTSEKCAEFDISGEDADDYRMHGFVAYSELGEQFHAAILRMPHAEISEVQ